MNNIDRFHPSRRKCSRSHTDSKITQLPKFGVLVDHRFRHYLSPSQFLKTIQVSRLQKLVLSSSIVYEAALCRQQPVANARAANGERGKNERCFL